MNWIHQELSYFLVTVNPFLLIVYLNRILRVYLECLLEKDGLHLSQNDFYLYLVSKLSTNSFLQFLFNLTTKLRCFFYFIKSSTDLVLLALFFNWERFIIAFLKILLIWGFWLPRKIFYSFGAWLFNVSTKFVSNVW